MTEGRRNCKRCARWKLAIEFRWRWRRPRAKGPGVRARPKAPTIDSVCLACRRHQEKLRYSNLPASERRALGQRANANAKLRKERDQAKLKDKIRAVNLIVNNSKTKYGSETVLPLMPFRLWLIAHVREYKDIVTMAAQAGVDEAELRRYLEGIYWESDCTPRPVSGITLGKVDAILTSLDLHYQLASIYPFVGEDE